MKAAALLLLPLLAGPVLAQDWVTVGRSGAGVLAGVEKSSAQAGNGHVVYWDRLVYPEPQPVGIFDNTPMKGEFAKGATLYVEMRALQDVDCERHTLLTSREEFFDASGVSVSRATSVIGPRAVAPDSIGGREAALLCPPAH